MSVERKTDEGGGKRDTLDKFHALSRSSRDWRAPSSTSFSFSSPPPPSPFSFSFSFSFSSFHLFTE